MITFKILIMTIKNHKYAAIIINIYSRVCVLLSFKFKLGIEILL